MFINDRYSHEPCTMMKITIYGTENCPWTEKVTDWFETRGVKRLTFLDVIKDFKAREEMITKSNQHTIPVTDLDGEIVVGYDKNKLEQALLR